MYESLIAAVEDQGCNSWSDLQHEMALKSWDEACLDKWTRLAKRLAMLKINIQTLEHLWVTNEGEEKPSSWAEVTRKLRHLRQRLEETGGSKDTWCSQIWDLDQEEWKASYSFGNT